MADEEATSPGEEAAAAPPAAEAPADAPSDASATNDTPPAEAAVTAAPAADAKASLMAELEAATQLANQRVQEAPAPQSHRKPQGPAAEAPSPPTFTLGPAVPVSDEIRRILRLEVPVIVKLADKRLSLGDIIDLSPGSIVEFTKSAEQSLELMVNNKIVGRGVAVKVGEKFGLRIEEILPVSQTIRNLGN